MISSAPPIEKNQNDRGITLSPRFSETIYWTRKRKEKNACPTNPTDSQNCSLLIAPPRGWKQYWQGYTVTNYSGLPVRFC